MIEDKKIIQQQLSELIYKDIVKIITEYSTRSILDLNLIVILVQDINLLKVYEINYVHNSELNELIELMRNELKNSIDSKAIAILTCFDFLQNSKQDFKKMIYVNLSLKVPNEVFLEAFSFFNVLVSNVKELFSDFILYIFNNRFLTLDENIQIETIYKIWNFSKQLYHDNEASKFAYENLKLIFNKALLFEKTEVAFWLYYTPLHYFNSGTGSNIDEVNEKFKHEIEKPLEKYILEKLIPKYSIKINHKKINVNKKVKVCFVMQRIIRHSTVNVFYRLVKTLIKENSNRYEFCIYDLAFPEAGGSEENFVKEFKDLGIKYINLHQRIFGKNNPTYSLLKKCIKTREILIDENIDIMIGLHTRVEYLFLYACRVAAKQIYWYHGSNSQYDVKGIDLIINHCTPISSSISLDFQLPIYIEEYNPEVDMEIVQEIKKNYPKGSFILGYIGRLIKIEDDRYLDTVGSIMNQNPHTIFLACGSGDQRIIKQKIERLGLSERFYFTGHVNSHVYSYVLDLFLVSFLHAGGESLQEYMYKEKPFVFKFPTEERIQQVILEQRGINILEKIERKDEDYVFSDLYTKEDKERLKENNYLYSENNFFGTYSLLQSVCNEEDYINITNLFINNYEIAQKAAKETMIKAKSQNKIRNFFEALDS